METLVKVKRKTTNGLWKNEFHSNHLINHFDRTSLFLPGGLSTVACTEDRIFPNQKHSNGHVWCVDWTQHNSSYSRWTVCQQPAYVFLEGKKIWCAPSHTLLKEDHELACFVLTQVTNYLGMRYYLTLRSLPFFCIVELVSGQPKHRTWSFYLTGELANGFLRRPSLRTAL